MKKREYKNIFAITDYNIPMFGFKSAGLIIGMTFISLNICIYTCQFIEIDFRIIISGLVSGFSVAYSRLLLKKEISKAF